MFNVNCSLLINNETWEFTITDNHNYPCCTSFKLTLNSNRLKMQF